MTTVELPEGPAKLIRDPDGASFFMVGVASASRVPWKAWAGLALIIAGMVTGWAWIWAVFFGGWLWVGLQTGETYVFERVSKRTEPPLYWTLMASYLVFFVGALMGKA